MDLNRALALMILGWMFGFGFGWVLRDKPRSWSLALVSTAFTAVVVLLVLDLLDVGHLFL